MVKALNPLVRCAFGNVCFNVCSCPQKPDQLQTEGQENKIMKGHTFGKEEAEGEIMHKITMADREIWSQNLLSFKIYNLRRIVNIDRKYSKSEILQRICSLDTWCMTYLHGRRIILNR